MPGRRQPSRTSAALVLGPGRWILLCLAISLGCHQRAYMAPVGDAAVGDVGGDLFAPLTLDISVTGCPSFDVVNVVCSGSAPMTVSFAPVGSPALTTFLWTFGDGTQSSSERAPSHTYALPGKYDVSVTGQGSTVGSLSQIRRQLISVEPLTTGAACDVDSQCGDGLHCRCKSGSGCGAGVLSRNLHDHLPDWLLRRGRSLRGLHLGSSGRRGCRAPVGRSANRAHLPGRLLRWSSMRAWVRLPADPGRRRGQPLGSCLPSPRRGERLRVVLSQCQWGTRRRRLYHRVLRRHRCPRALQRRLRRDAWVPARRSVRQPLHKGHDLSAGLLSDDPLHQRSIAPLYRRDRCRCRGRRWPGDHRR